MYTLVNKDLRLLSEARLRLRYMMGGVDSAINRVPLYLRDNQGLVYERLRWRNRRGRLEGSLEILYKNSNRTEAQMVRPVSYTHLTLPTNREV